MKIYSLAMRESRLKPWIYRKHCQKLDTIILLKLCFALHEKKILKKLRNARDFGSAYRRKRAEKPPPSPLLFPSQLRSGKHAWPSLEKSWEFNHPKPHRESFCWLGNCPCTEHCQLRLCCLQRSTKQAGTHSHRHVVLQPGEKFLHSLVLHPPKQMQEFVAWKVENYIVTGW